MEKHAWHGAHRRKNNREEQGNAMKRWALAHR